MCEVLETFALHPQFYDLNRSSSLDKVKWEKLQLAVEIIFLSEPAIIKLGHVDNESITAPISDSQSKHISGKLFPVSLFSVQVVSLCYVIVVVNRNNNKIDLLLNMEKKRRESNCQLQATFELILITE